MCPASGRNDSLTVVQRDQEPRSRGQRSEAWREEDGRWDQENKVKQGREERAVSSLSGLVGPWGHESRAPGCPLIGCLPIFAFTSNRKVFFFPFSFIQSSHMHEFS